MATTWTGLISLDSDQVNRLENYVVNDDYPGAYGYLAGIAKDQNLENLYSNPDFSNQLSQVAFWLASAQSINRPLKYLNGSITI